LIPKRRNKRRSALARRRSRDLTLTEGDSTATDVEEISRRAHRLVQLARGDHEETAEDTDTIDPHTIASRARRNGRR
jgi:hypothetical protein